MLRCVRQSMLVLTGLCCCIAQGQATRPTSGPSDPRVAARFGQISRLSTLTGRSGGRANPEIHRQFVEIEQIARLPNAERNAQMPHLYRDIVTSALMDVNNERGLHAVPGNPFVSDRTDARGDFTAQYAALLDEAAKTMSPGEAADQIAATFNSAILQIAARRRAIWIFKQDLDGLKKLIDADLATDNPEGLTRAFAAIEGVELTQYAPQAVRVMLVKGQGAIAAEHSLDTIGGPEAIRELVAAAEKNPQVFTDYSAALSRMLRGKPPEPALTKLLDSPDPELRATAAKTMQYVDAGSAIDLIPRLLTDPDERVRIPGLEIAFRLPPELFGAIRATLLPSLKSLSIRERVRAAEGLAIKRDPACAQTLLEFAMDPHFPTEYRMQVSRDIHNLLGQRGTMMYDSRNWGADATGFNKEMISQLQQWIASQSR